MKKITINVPEDRALDYKIIFTKFAREYNIDELNKISENKFYLDMLDWVFDEWDFNEIEKKNWKLNLDSLLV